MKNQKTDKHIEEIKKLADAIDRVEDEKLLLENQLKKALADYANLQRDIEKRVGLREDQMKMQIALTVMGVLDDTQMAMKASESLKLTPEIDSWLVGLKAIMMKLEKTVTEFGIERIDVKEGDQFDSSSHEAVATTPGGQKGMIHEVIQPGYTLGEIVVRPARVVVQQGE